MSDAADIRDLADLSPDPANPNRGTERGRYMLERSLRDAGAGRSIVVDRAGRVIAGNKTLETWAELGGEIEVVRTDGRRLVVVQREDLDLDDPTGAARKLSFYDNRVGEVSLEWDPDELFNSLNQGLDLSDMFFANEIEDLLGEKVEELVAEDATKPEPASFNYQEQYGVIVMCRDAKEQETVYNRLQAEGFTVKVVVT